ncbi:hypothetical protein BH09ACT4_BH09ACT4_01390 [soil metagenome]
MKLGRALAGPRLTVVTPGPERTYVALETVTPTIPTSLTRIVEEPCAHEAAIASVSHICHWVRAVSTPEPIHVWNLKGAWVFGGRIHGRTDIGHDDGQLVLTRRFGLITPSWGIMDGNRTLPRNLVPQPGSDRSRLRWPDHRRGLGGALRRASRRPERRLRGTYFLLGSEHGHFGHVMLEGLSRLWALASLKDELDQGMRFLIYEDSIPDWAHDLLERAGVQRDRIVFASEVDFVEHLIVAEPAMRTHRWITTGMAEVWQRIGDSVAPGNSTRVYLTRANMRNRGLANEDRVAELFREAGFRVVAPETLPVEEQIALARGADVLAGPVGSQMYLAAFQKPGAQTVVFAPANFYLKDDVLIASALDHELDVRFGTEVPLESRKVDWTWEIGLDLVEDVIRSSR